MEKRCRNIVLDNIRVYHEDHEFAVGIKLADNVREHGLWDRDGRRLGDGYIGV